MMMSWALTKNHALNVRKHMYEYHKVKCSKKLESAWSVECVGLVDSCRISCYLFLGRMSLSTCSELCSSAGLAAFGVMLGWYYNFTCQNFILPLYYVLHIPPVVVSQSAIFSLILDQLFAWPEWALLIGWSDSYQRRHWLLPSCLI